MKHVLEMLGLGPCHHMIEVMENPAQLPYWKAFAAGEQVDWTEVYDGYTAQVDWPGAKVWEEASIAFPDAKIIHTERPEDLWWNSFNGTIGKFFVSYEKLDLPPYINDVASTMKDWLMDDSFTDFTDRDSTIAAYRLNNEKVRDTIPSDRLLVFHVADGWEPLCRFLELPVPDTEFPHLHPKKEFWEHFGGEPE